MDSLLIIAEKETKVVKPQKKITSDKEKSDILAEHINRAMRLALADYIRAWDVDGEWVDVVSYDGVEVTKGNKAFVIWCLDNDRILSDVSEEIPKSKSLGIKVDSVITSNPAQWLIDHDYSVRSQDIGDETVVERVR